MALRLSRRTMLRGIGGAVVGLPLLECMLEGRGKAGAQTPGPYPTRFVIVFAGQALGGDGFPEDQQRIGGTSITESGHFIVPPETGAGYTVTTPLQPLASLVNDFSLVSGMRIPYSTTSAEPTDVPTAGAFRDFHGGGCSPLLSGTKSTSPNFQCNGVTSDQVIAQMNSGATTHESLVLRAQPSWYLSGSSYSGREFISYRGARDPIDAQVSPETAYRSLFGGFTPMDDPAAAAQHDFELRARRSVLDVVSQKRDRILGRVGRTDKVRLERHFDEIRALEMRIAAIPPLAAGQCVLPTAPGADPPVGGDNAGSGAAELATNTGYSGEDERARAMVDLIHMALVCDLTRVATLQITVFQSHMNVYTITSAMGTPILADLHEVGHNGDPNNKGQLAVSLCLKWHIGHYAYLLDKLKATPEGDGNVLDHSVVLFVPEAGHGTQLNDASSPFATHSVENMAMLVAGRAGGLLPGRHIATAGVHPAQCLVGAMQAAGYAGDSLGEVTGTIPELFG